MISIPIPHFLKFCNTELFLDWKKSQIAVAAQFGNLWRALDTFWRDGDFSIRPNPFDPLVSVFSASMTSAGI